MKTPAIILLCCCATVLAQTNVIDLKNRPVQFVDLKGKEYNVRLVRASLDGVLYSKEGGGGLLRFTNVSPQVVASWGIPTNWIAMAAQQAKAKGEAEALWKSSYDARAGQLATRRDFQMALIQVKSVCDQRRQAAEAKVKSVEDRVNALRVQIDNAKVQRDGVWDRYINTGASQWSSTMNGRASSVDNEATRLANARALDRNISSGQDQLFTLERDLERAKDTCEKETQKIAEECQEQARIIQERYKKVSEAAAAPDK
jgi:hypothetical protein